MSKWLSKNWPEVIIFLSIILIAAFLRFYRLPEYMTFLGDEGRDALMIKRILVDHDFPLLGPPTSIGNIYLGPLYYYMMTLPMWFFWLNPVAAAGMVAGLGVATVGLIYYLARVWFGKLPAAVAAFLFAISPVTIVYSRSSWNPNPAPFFAMLAFLGLYKARQSRNFYWLVLVGVALAFIIQMHYLALILLPTFVILWAFELRAQVQGADYRNFVLGTVFALLAFVILMSPLVIFDLRYNLANFRAMEAFFSNRETTVNLNIVNSVGRVLPVYYEKLVGRYLTAENSILASLVSVAVIIPTLLLLWKRALSWPYFILSVWLIGAMAGLSLYKQTIYDHYLGFVSPAPYLLLGGLVAFLKGKWQKIGGGVILLALAFLNFQKSPLQLPPNNQLQKTQEIARFIIEQSENKPFNFALIAAHNYDAAYQFYLDIYGHKPKVVPLEVTDQLFVVCEDQVCQPIGHPKYEIAAFGWAKIERESEILGVKVYKLIANPDGKPS